MLCRIQDVPKAEEYANMTLKKCKIIQTSQNIRFSKGEEVTGTTAWQTCVIIGRNSNTLSV